MSVATPTDALSQEIAELKQQLNAIILVHNYQVPEIQDIGDYVGDSLGLAQQAAATDADVIVFCGVHFMAETAKILSPEKTVILPDRDAGCSLEESCPPDKLRELQATTPNFFTVTYPMSFVPAATPKKSSSNVRPKRICYSCRMKI